MSALEAPLADVTVVELGHIIAGPYCGLLLADLGADVIKVEHPEHGDVFRGASPGASSAFNYVNRNKRGIALDLKDEGGRQALYDVVAEADVVVENFAPGAVEGLGIDYDTLRERNPELIYCSVKGFNAGPYEDRPALDPVAEALSGLMSTTGYPEHPPARCGASVADMAASLQGAMAVVGAVRQRDHTGEGQHITAPMFESTVGLIGNGITYSDTYGEPMAKWRGGGQGHWCPYGVYQAGDGGWVFIGPSSQDHWLTLCDALGMEHLAEDERFETLPDRQDHRDELDAALEAEFEQYTREEILAMLEGQPVPVATVNSTLEAAEDPHLAATDQIGLVRPTQEGVDRDVKVPRSPLRSTGFPHPEAEDPPMLGEHTAEVLGELGYDEERIAALRDRGAI